MKLAKWCIRNNELLWWTIALVLLFFLDAEKPGRSLCPSVWLGFAGCPGCGLGHAIHYALHFQFSQSFGYHILGIPAVIIIFIRIKQLLFKLTNPICDPIS